MKFLLLATSLSGLTTHVTIAVGNHPRRDSAIIANKDDNGGGASGGGISPGYGSTYRWKIFDIVPPKVEDPDESLTGPTPSPSSFKDNKEPSPTPHIRSRHPTSESPASQSPTNRWTSWKPVSVPQSSFPSTLPPVPPFDPFDRPCDPNWNTTKTEFEANLQNVWTNPDCYDFYLKRTCYCPYLSGSNDPVFVSVRNGTVVEPVDGNVPTMQELLERVRTQCVANCPSSGAEVCQVTFGPLGNVQDFYYDVTSLMADEEQGFTITNFTLCSASSR